MKGSAKLLSFSVMTAALLAFMATAALAQTGSAVVKGTVADASQSVVPNAKVTLTNLDTNIAKTAQTSGVGVYYFASNQPGRYSITVESQGFKKWTGSLVLEVGQTAVVDALMQVGSADTTIEVTAAAPLVTVEGTEIADVKDSVRIQQIPLNGRSLSTLFDMAPGVEGAAGGQFAPGARVNGMKVGAMEMTVDGVSIVDRFRGDITQIQPSLETVREFRTETTGSSAKYSRPSTVTVVTKSGTNTLHGSFFETNRTNSSGLRARRREDTGEAAHLVRNEFGASAGGPVFLPHVYDGRNRTFWFFSYEGSRQREQSYTAGNVPTEQMWNGDFSNLSADNAGHQIHIYDPLSTDANGNRVAFAGDKIPQNLMNPILSVLKPLTHTPTNSTNPYLGTNLITNYPLKTDQDMFTAKLDHRFSDKDSLTGRFSKGNRLYDLTGGDSGFPALGVPNIYGGFIRRNSDINANLTYVHVFSPNLLSELLIGTNRNPNHSGTQADSTDWASKLGLPNPFGEKGWPTIWLPPGAFYWDSANIKDQNLTAHSIEDNVTWVKGRHSIQLGGKYRREYNNVREMQQAQGSHMFYADWTGLYDPQAGDLKPFTGDSFASMALGLPTYLSAQYNRGYYYFRQSEMGLYVHDSFKVSPRLTLELGLRWDKWTPYQEKYNRLLNINLDTLANTFQVVTPGDHTMESLPGIPPSVLNSWSQRGLTWTTADKAGLPSALLPADNNNFGPRVGFAYRLNDKTTLRAGYGEFFWTMPLSQILAASRTDPPLNLRFEQDYKYKDGTVSWAQRNTPPSDLYLGKAQINTTGLVSLPSTARPFMPWDYTRWQDGHSRAWNISIEREIFHETAVRLSYIGNHGGNLEQRFNINSRESQYNYMNRTGQAFPGRLDLLRVNPQWNLNSENKTGYSNTNELQANVERRFAKGVSFQWFYVFTRSMSTSDGNASSSGNGSLSGDATGFTVPESGQILGEPNMTYDQRLRLGYQNSSVVPAHRVRWNGVLELPFGRGRHFGNNMSRGLDLLVGGWHLAPAGYWRSGNWMSVNPWAYLFGDPSLKADQRLLMTYNGRTQRLWFRGDFDPAQASNVDSAALLNLIPANEADRVMHPLGSNPQSLDNRLPVKLADGSVRYAPVSGWDVVSWNARSFFKGPGDWNADMGLVKSVAFGERAKAQFRADFFNFLNHPVDIDPDTYTGLQDLSRQNNEPRMIQFSLRLDF